MKVAKQFFDRLACPSDAAPLTQAGDALRCTRCNAEYPIVNGIPRFVAGEKYVSSFGQQWNTHARTVIDGAGVTNESEQILRQAFGLTPEFVRGKWVLDAGCGAGRFSEVMARWGANIIAADLSSAVEAARNNLGSFPNVLVVQADIFELPLVERSFDIVYSNGVLHHSANTRRAFHEISRFVADGGYTTVYLYADYGDNRFIDRWRRYTSKMNGKVLHALCGLAGPLAPLRKIPGLNLLMRPVYKYFPMNAHPSWDTRVLLTFDLYAPKYRWRHTYPEVHGWFREEGYTDVRLFDEPLILGGFMERSAKPRPRPLEPLTPRQCDYDNPT
jgi:SAM-dependent methyltransferase